MAKNLGPIFVVEVAMMLPVQETAIRLMMWIERSPERPAVQVTESETIKVRNHTGTVRSRVGTVP